MPGEANQDKPQLSQAETVALINERVAPTNFGHNRLSKSGFAPEQLVGAGWEATMVGGANPRYEKRVGDVTTTILAGQESLSVTQKLPPTKEGQEVQVMLTESQKYPGGIAITCSHKNPNGIDDQSSQEATLRIAPDGRFDSTGSSVNASKDDLLKAVLGVNYAEVKSIYAPNPSEIVPAVIKNSGDLLSLKGRQ